MTRNFVTTAALKSVEYSCQVMVIELNDRLRKLCILFLAVLPAVAAAQNSSELSADLPDPRLLEIQRKVDSLYESGQYERAFFIYRKELVPLGDKYAQYMVGHMYLTGLGVEQDFVQASAWYRLAAERDTLEFVAVRDQLIAKLAPQQRTASDTVYLELRREYSDLAVLLASIKRNVRELGDNNGLSRTISVESQTIVRSNDGRVWTGNDYYLKVRRQLRERLDLLQDFGGFDDLKINVNNPNIREIERRVNELIESIELVGPAD